MAVSDIGRDHAMVTNLLEAIARGRASFAISLPAETLGASEGGPRAGHGIGIGVAAHSESSSDGLAVSVRGVGGSEQLPVPTRPSAAISAGAAEGTPSAAGMAAPSTTGRESVAGSLQPQPPCAGAQTTPSEGTPSTGVTFQADQPGAEGGSLVGRLSAGVGGVDARTGTSGSKSDGSTPGGGGLTVTKYRSARSVDADIMATMVASVRPRNDDNTADHGSGAGVVGSPDATPSSALAAPAKGGRDVYGPEVEWGLSEAEGGRAGAGAGADAGDGVTITAVLGALKDNKEGGMRLSQLGRAAAAACRARAARKSAARGRGDAGQTETKQELFEFMGRVLRSPKVFCVCDAEDVRFVRAMRQALRDRNCTC